MNKALEELWNEYFAEKCAVINTKEEKSLAKKAVEMHKEAGKSLTKEQNDAIEKYVDILYEIQNSFVKKSFFKGCEFAISLLIEVYNFAEN